MDFGTWIGFKKTQFHLYLPLSPRNSPEVSQSATSPNTKHVAGRSKPTDPMGVWYIYLPQCHPCIWAIYSDLFPHVATTPNGDLVREMGPLISGKSRFP